MASEILGLFSSPELYQQQQDLMQQQQAAQLAQLDPYASVRYNAIRAGQQAGSALGGIFGAQDPQLRLISARQQVMQNVDPSNPEAVLQAAQQLANIGDQQGALTLADYARKAQSELALQQQRLREGKAAATPKELQIAGARAELQDRISQLKLMPASPERDRAIAIAENTLAGLTTAAKTGQIPDVIEIARERAKAKSLTEGTPAYNEFIDKEIERQTTKDAKTPTANIKEVGVAQGTNKAVYLDVNNDQQFTYERGADGKQIRQPYFGGVDRTTAKVSASASAKGETAFAEQLGKNDAKAVTQAIEARDNSIAALNSLQRLTQLDQSGLISGAFASNRAGLTNFLDTIGLTSQADKDRLASSENYQKVAGDIVLATLGGRLGAGFSNEDRKFIQGLVPQLETSPQARKQLLDFLVRKNQAIVEETTRLETYARENNGLKGFVPKIPLVTVAKPGSAAAMTDEQLREQYNKLKSKGK